MSYEAYKQRIRLYGPTGEPERGKWPGGLEPDRSHDANQQIRPAIVRIKAGANILQKHVGEDGVIEHWYRDGQRVDVRWPDDAVTTGLNLDYLEFKQETP